MKQGERKPKTDVRVCEDARANISPAVIKRLPRYFRYLRELIRMDQTRVSSAELSKMMKKF